MDDQRQDNQLEPIYSSSVPIRDVALKTRQKQWTIEKGGKKGSGISVLMAWHDDDDEFVGNFIFKWVRTNCFHTRIVIVSTQFIILFNINHLFVHIEVVTSIAI